MKTNTSVGNEWLAARLEMRHNRSVSRLIRQGNRDADIEKLCSKLKKMLPCEDSIENLWLLPVWRNPSGNRLIRQARWHTNKAPLAAGEALVSTVATKPLDGCLRRP